MSFNVRERNRVVLDCSGDRGLTEQSHKDSCDINNIMNRALKTGIVEHVARVGGKYGDFANSLEYHDAMNVIASANSMFETVPAEIRKKFGNEPGRYVDFMTNPDNYQAILDMGLDASHLPKPPEIVLEAAPPTE